MESERNPAERLVARLARRSFLSLWSYANARGKHGKELCDVLAVCDPDVVIISVKHLAMPDTGNVSVDWQRWRRGAVDESVKQIYGAERWLRSARNVIRSDGTPGLSLPDPARRSVHRVAVALGSSESVPISMGDFGKGFVHVLTEESLEVILAEMDTVDDLTSYLTAKERFLQDLSRRVICESEKDLLATYLAHERQFPEGANLIVIGDDIWDGLVKRPEYVAKKEADRESYVWDGIINHIAQYVLDNRLEFGSELNDNELGLRVMAREGRLARRMLGKSFKEFFELARNQEVRARFVKSPSGVGYVFLARPHGYPRDVRTAELGSRCLVVRGLHPDVVTVVGLATEQYAEGGASRSTSPTCTCLSGPPPSKSWWRRSGRS